jgi:hypothetical protein
MELLAQLSPAQRTLTMVRAAEFVRAACGLLSIAASRSCLTPRST